MKMSVTISELLVTKSDQFIIIVSDINSTSRIFCYSLSGAAQ